MRVENCFGELNMSNLENRFIGLLTVLVMFLSASSHAQAEEMDPLEAEAAAALMEGLETKKPKPKSDKDPDIKLLKKVDKERAAMEKRLNVLQTKSQKFADIQDGINEISQQFLAATDEYFTSHGDALDAYQTAESAGDKKVIKMTAKRVIKIRKTLLKAMKKLDKGFKKLEKLEKKLSKLAAKEDAEDAEKAEKEKAASDKAAAEKKAKADQ